MTLDVRRVILAAAFLMGATLAPPHLQAQSCGVERWSVKTGTDADKGLVNVASSTSNTIVTLRSWPAPNPIPANNRVAPYETTVWVLDATLVEYKSESDSDYHLVLKDAAGNTMIGEIPLPACVGSSSPFLSKITSARSKFDAMYNPTGSFQTANIPVRVTGVGMFDFLHGQTGVAPNGIELHPILDIVFNPSTSPDFSISASPAAVIGGAGELGDHHRLDLGLGRLQLRRRPERLGGPLGRHGDLHPDVDRRARLRLLQPEAHGGDRRRRHLHRDRHRHGGRQDAHDDRLVHGHHDRGTRLHARRLALVRLGRDRLQRHRDGDHDGQRRLQLGGRAVGLRGPRGRHRDLLADLDRGARLRLVDAHAGDRHGRGGHLQPDDHRHRRRQDAHRAAHPDRDLRRRRLADPRQPRASSRATSPGTASSGAINTSASEPAHSGSWKAWLDGYGTTHTDTLYQQVAIFSTKTSATLTFWLHIDTAETTTTIAYDTLAVQVRNSSGTLLQTLATYSNLNAGAGYAQKTFDLSAYIGQTIRVYLTATEDSQKQTSFVVDDFALNVQ